MGQVSQKKSYTIVGNGRLARHLSHYFDLVGLSFRRWNRDEHAHLPIPQADTTFILIRDGAIEDFIRSHPELRERRLVHCSGSLVIPLAEGWHPLMTFADELYDLGTYQQISFIAEREHQALGPAFPDLINPVFFIPQKDRPLYHSLCVLSGNFTVMLWGKLFRELEGRWQISAAAAHPYLRQITANLITRGERALSGPLIRGDQQTIDKNIQALNEDAYQSVYRAFVAAYSHERGHYERP
jgi:predicted short-subunit dehydrogenase-like oxidoreductase (DUF2520 family)